MKSVKMSCVATLIIFFGLITLPLSSQATLIQPGDIVRVDFDLSSEFPAPPYEGIYISTAFSSSNYLNTGEGFTIRVFDDGGQGLDDGTGYYLLFDIIGTFDLTEAWASGRFYSGSTVIDTTPPVAGSISLISSLPDLSMSLANFHIVNKTTPGDTSWYGVDMLLTQTAIPEPSMILLMAAGLSGIVILRKRSFG